MSLAERIYNQGTCRFPMDDGKPCGEPFTARTPNTKTCPRHRHSERNLRGITELRKRLPSDRKGTTA